MGKKMKAEYDFSKGERGKFSKANAELHTPRPTPSDNEIADMATRGEYISGFFTNQSTVVRPVRRINVELTQGMLRELDERAAKLNISRQAVIKTPLRQAMDQDRPAPPSRKRRVSQAERQERNRSK
jgi:hypothetical protein